MKTLIINLFFVISLNCFSQPTDQIWPQFRGVNSMGVAADDANPPINLSEKNIQWEINIPDGSSSPIIWNDKIVITAYDKMTRELQTQCLNRITGKKEWIQSFRPDTIGLYHSVGSAAQTTSVTDGINIISYFGTWGLICYDFTGNKKWEFRIPFVLNRFGYNSSPIIEGNKVILSKDFGDDRFLLALDTNTGDIIWKKELSPVGLSNDVFSTPVVNNNQIILHRGNEISSYSLTNGTRLWWFPVNTMGTSTPVVYNNTIFVSAWSNMSDKEQYTNPLSFNEFLRKYDKNTNGTISIEEIPEDLFIYQRNEIKDIPSTSGSYKKFFGFFDSNNNGEITSNEYDTCFKMLESFYRESGFIALSPENSGELNYSSLLWSVKEHAPEVPSPLIYNDNAYLIKDGGILTCVDLKSGQVHFRERVGNSGLYLASPVAANGHVFLLSYNGKLKVIKATDNYEVAGEYDFKEKISATPAIIGNAIYIRTAKSLYAFWN